MSILAEIFAYKQQEVAERQHVTPLDDVRRAAELAPPALDFSSALRANRKSGLPGLIAEVKCASPSRGLLVKDFDPLALAQTFQQNGAAAISVLTDERYFKGHLDYLRAIAGLQPRLPLLRKDFICDPYQVYEARAAGADAVLLIAAHLDLSSMQELHSLICDLGMAALVEVHNREELDKAMQCQPQLIGINNRDLRDFTVNLDTTLSLRPYVPAEICLVAESGIHTREDITRLAQARVDAVLIGEALVVAADVAAKVRSLAI
jgi:indole-3-glycerol phosphate synthase